MTYEVIILVVGLVFGVLVVMFRKKIVARQIKRASEKEDFFSKKLANYPQRRMEIHAVIAGVGIIIISIIKFIQIFIG